jgi:acetylornithine deacetylase/succinyl-diaminopimelate desuccinylase-like protein
MEVISLKEKDLLEKLCGSVSKQEIVDLTRKLIRIPSHWDVPTLEREMVDELIKYCDDNGLDYKLQPVDEQRSNIIVRLSGSWGGKSLALNGHLDTVPPYNMTV